MAGRSTIIAGVVSISAASVVQAENRDQYYYMVECAAMMMQTEIVYYEMRSEYIPIQGERLPLSTIDYYESRSMTLLNYLKAESSFRQDAQGHFDQEVEGWMRARNLSDRASTLNVAAIRGAGRCIEDFSAAGWFQ